MPAFYNLQTARKTIKYYSSLYNGHRDSSSIKRWLLGFLPSPILDLNRKEFENEVLTAKELPWLVDFYAPWCGHCHRFEPEFITVAQVRYELYIF